MRDASNYRHFMESVRVRGCVVPVPPSGNKVPWRQADASRRQNGPRKTTALRGPSRSRCGLEVSPAPSPSSYTTVGREKVGSGIKLREPQQAIVGSKTRSAGRTPSPKPRTLEQGVASWT
jgi:hypothetical protein